MGQSFTKYLSNQVSEVASSTILFEITHQVIIQIIHLIVRSESSLSSITTTAILFSTMSTISCVFDCKSSSLIIKCESITAIELNVQSRQWVIHNQENFEDYQVQLTFYANLNGIWHVAQSLKTRMPLQDVVLLAILVMMGYLRRGMFLHFIQMKGLYISMITISTRYGIIYNTCDDCNVEDLAGCHIRSRERVATD